MSQNNVVVQESDLPWERWNDDAICATSPILWKTLITADRLDSTSITLGITEIAPGQIEVSHHHPTPEAYYFLSGQGIVRIDGVSHAMSPGAAVFIPSDSEHEVINTGNETLKFLRVFPTDTLGDVDYSFPDHPSVTGIC